MRESSRGFYTWIPTPFLPSASRRLGSKTKDLPGTLSSRSALTHNTISHHQRILLLSEVDSSTRTTPAATPQDPRPSVRTRSAPPKCHRQASPPALDTAMAFMPFTVGRQAFDPIRGSTGLATRRTGREINLKAPLGQHPQLWFQCCWTSATWKLDTSGVLAYIGVTNTDQCRICVSAAVELAARPPSGGTLHGSG